MEVLKLILSAVGSLVTLFLLSKLLGNKQISQLNLFDYINGITIGSIAAEMATEFKPEIWQPLLAMTIYALVTFLIDLGARKSLALRRFFEGRSIVLYENGRLNYDGFRSARIDLCEFLSQCRSNGYFTLTDLEVVVIEANGRLSFLPKSDKRPATPSDFNLRPEKASPAVPVIFDGSVLEGNLKSTGRDSVWLDKQLKANHAKSSELFLAMVESDGTLSAYKKETTHEKRSRFQ